MAKEQRIKDIKRILPALQGHRIKVFNTLNMADPLGEGVVTGTNNNRDEIRFEDWKWWNGDRVTVNYIAMDTVKRIAFV